MVGISTPAHEDALGEANSRTPTRGAFRTLTFRLLEHVAAELNHADAQQRLKEHVIDPLIRMLYLQLSPYVMVVCAVMLVILLTSLCTCTMFALFFFKGPRR